MTVLDVCLCLQTLSDAIISFSFKLACCSFQRGVSENRTEARAVFLPAVTARLSVKPKRRAGGKRERNEGENPASSSSSSDLTVWFFGLKTADTCQACESAPGAVYQSRSGAALGISGAPEKKKKKKKKNLLYFLCYLHSNAECVCVFVCMNDLELHSVPAVWCLFKKKFVFPFPLRKSDVFY